MFVNFILWTSTLAIVCARNLNKEATEDHAPKPKYDFSSHEDHFMRSGTRELSSNGFKVRGDRDFHDHRSFDLQFNQRQFHHSDNRKEIGRDSGSLVHHGPDFSKSEYHDFSIGTLSNRDSENNFRSKIPKERNNHARGSRDSDFTLETFKSESNIRDSNIQEQRNVNKRYNFTNFLSNHGFNHYSPDLGFGNFEEHLQRRNFDERRNMDKRINENNNVQNSNFNTSFFNSGPLFNGRKTEERNVRELDVQIQDNEEHFDTLSSSHHQNFHNNKERRRTHSQQNKENTEKITRSNINTRTSEKIQHQERSDNKHMTTLAPKKSNERPSGRDNSEMDQRPIFQTSAKPDVDNKKETNDDEWVWSDGSENKPPTNHTKVNSTSSPDLDDRAAFNGDKCPNGRVRVGSICAAVD